MKIHVKLSVGWTLSVFRYKPRTSQIQSRSAKCSKKILNTRVATMAPESGYWAYDALCGVM